MKPLKRLHKGDFNTMNQERQPDGSVIITLVKDGDPKPCRFRVRDLYGPEEEELDVIKGTPKH